jgi:tRNA threonylcarbamoyladenosine biosynthesis protein TsaE
MRYISKSPAQTQKIGLKLAKKLKGGEILGLIGDLGSGKTCFVKGLASGLGVKRTITSPTFIFLRVLPINKKRGGSKKRGVKFLIHLDLYRLTNKRGLENIIPLDFFNKKNVVTVVEWAERIRGSLPKKASYIKFKVLRGNQREIVF